MTSSQENERCRLCGGALQRQFNLTVLNRYDVSYYKCLSCSSLMTEAPFWLDEAYRARLGIGMLDTGAARRNIDNFSVSYLICKILNASNHLDIGAGDGLLCRLLRDYGINAFAVDKYGQPTYAQGFTKPDFGTPDTITAFEVLEHFASPKDDLKSIFDRNPNALLITTCIYCDQDSEWWYLVPDEGQHIFFYSESAISLIGSTFGYEVIMSGSRVLFLRKGVYRVYQRWLARFAMKRKISKLVGACILLCPATGIWRDYFLLKNRPRIQ